MLPFDRLIVVADAWAAATGHEVFAQIGNGQYEPQHMAFARMLTPGQFTAHLTTASVIVAHAGMGTVISAMEAGKPIVVMPRRAAKQEVTTDHQIHTANWLMTKPAVYVATTEANLASAIDRAVARPGGMPLPLQDCAPSQFIARIRDFLDT
jgi:exopolysaccharide biosynthesis glucuronosyltransferase PssE